MRHFCLVYWSQSTYGVSRSSVFAHSLLLLILAGNLKFSLNSPLRTYEGHHGTSIVNSSNIYPLPSEWGVVGTVTLQLWPSIKDAFALLFCTSLKEIAPLTVECGCMDCPVWVRTWRRVLINIWPLTPFFSNTQLPPGMLPLRSLSQF